MRVLVDGYCEEWRLVGEGGIDRDGFGVGGRRKDGDRG